MTTPATNHPAVHTPSLSTAEALLIGLRNDGYRLWIKDGKVMISPLSKLTPERRGALRQSSQEILRLLEQEEQPESLLTPFDEPDWESLSDWWLSWNPPTEAYELCSGVTVSSPGQSYRYHADLVKGGCSGHTQLALYAWIKRHWQKFSADRSSDAVPDVRI